MLEAGQTVYLKLPQTWHLHANFLGSTRHGKALNRVIPNGARGKIARTLEGESVSVKFDHSFELVVPTRYLRVA